MKTILSVIALTLTFSVPTNAQTLSVDQTGMFKNVKVISVKAGTVDQKSVLTAKIQFADPCEAQALSDEFRYSINLNGSTAKINLTVDTQYGMGCTDETPVSGEIVISTPLFSDEFKTFFVNGVKAAK